MSNILDDAPDQLHVHVKFALIIVTTHSEQFIQLQHLIISYQIVVHHRIILFFTLTTCIFCQFPLPVDFSSVEFLLPLLLAEDPGRLHSDGQTLVVPAELTVLPRPQRHLAVIVLDTAVGVIVSTLN